MQFPADPPKNQFVRDYQVCEFEGPIDLIQGQVNTYAFNFPFRFIATELVARVIMQSKNVLANQTFTDVAEPAILTQLKYHQTLLDNQPVALRAAWGTARNPAKLPIPWAIEQGTNVSVDAQILSPAAGPVVAANITFRVIFSIRGYQPSDWEFSAIENRNNAICVRPYQSFTFTPRSGTTYMKAKVNGLGWDENDPNTFNIDFPMDIFVVRNVGEAFDGTNLDPTMQNPLDLPNAEISMSLFTKNANLFSTTDIFRNIFGTAEFPTKTFPNMQFKQGDFARMTLKNNVKTAVAPFLTLIGYAPTPASIRRGDIQRGRVKPEQYDPQSVTGGRAAR